ncbi:hypothetical protein [Miniimonas sp. S16]|uniref:hypothetical protein n=1 Tax=Miniimonas sp. S16 TaxID=2171623 RepID=UPI000D526CC2|nr:hypothetical protein [Miniimonas sp. S16]
MTVETPHVMPEADARRLTERIRLTAMSVRDGVEKLQRLVGEAQAGLAHLALGYASWTAYLADLFGDEPLRLPRDQRREIVGWLAGEGMSTRAIAPIVGASVGTVHADQVFSSEHLVPAPTIATAEGVVVADQHRVDLTTGEILDDGPSRFIAGPGIDGSLDVPDWTEDEIAEVMDPDSEGVTYSNQPIPETSPITGLDGKTYQRPEPKTPRRRPLTDAFWALSHDLTKKVDTLSLPLRTARSMKRCAASCVVKVSLVAFASPGSRNLTRHRTPSARLIGAGLTAMVPFCGGCPDRDCVSLVCPRFVLVRTPVHRPWSGPYRDGVSNGT